MTSFKIAFALAASLASFTSTAFAATQSREAWISTSSFDGKLFKYDYVAYDAAQPVQETAKIGCEYTRTDFGLLLKAVEVKIMIDAKFTDPGAQILRAGQVDVRQAVLDCERSLPNGKNAVKSPVEIRLPRISVPSDMN